MSEEKQILKRLYIHLQLPLKRVISCNRYNDIADNKNQGSILVKQIFVLRTKFDRQMIN